VTCLQVIQTLGLAQLQDGGRFGVRHLGVTQGGALDWVAMRWANWLLGNAPNACVLEIPYGNLTLRCDADTRLAISGGDLSTTLDGQPLENWTGFDVRAGQRLAFGPPVQGVRAYLAVPGGFKVEPVLGSCSTVTREGLGGLDGQGSTLKVGDRLMGDIMRPGQNVTNRAIPVEQRPLLSDLIVLDVVLGAQYAGFSGLSLFAAFNQPWRIDARGDRMGVRLTGPELRYKGAGLVSEGIPLGAIQVPPDGQPIILLNDRQTIGGYPRLGALEPLSVARLAQCPPGRNVWLQPVTLYTARRNLKAVLRATDR
jgi:5-oxoprolinase (ATP-hydrolysing) subunit C